MHPEPLAGIFADPVLDGARHHLHRALDVDGPVRVARQVEGRGQLEVEARALAAEVRGVPRLGRRGVPHLGEPVGRILTNALQKPVPTLSADALSDRLGIGLPADRDYATTAGFALSVLKHIPEVGERFTFGGWKFEIVDMDGFKIDKLLASEVVRKRRGG